ncbi:MAG: YncE family protein [Candidatus Nanopelagicales bacterium]
MGDEPVEALVCGSGKTAIVMHEPVNEFAAGGGVGSVKLTGVDLTTRLKTFSIDAPVGDNAHARLVGCSSDDYGYVLISPNQTSFEILRLDLTSGELTAVAQGEGLNPYIVMAPDGSVMYVFQEQVRVLDGASGAEIGQRDYADVESLAAAEPSLVDITPDGTTVLGLGQPEEAHLLTSLDTRDWTSTSVELESAGQALYEWGAATDGETYFVMAGGGQEPGALRRYTLPSGSPLAPIPVSGNREAVAVDLGGAWAYLTADEFPEEGDAGNIVVVDLESGATSNLSVGKGMVGFMDISRDGRVAVAPNIDDGSVSILERG